MRPRVTTRDGISSKRDREGENAYPGDGRIWTGFISIGGWLATSEPPLRNPPH